MSSRTRKKKASPVFPSKSELVMIAKPRTGLRAAGYEVAAPSGVDVSSLNTLLKAEGATITPTFGSEVRVKRALAPAGLEVAAETALTGLPDLSTFYHIDADEDKLETLVAELQAHDMVEAAYIAPPAEPPVIMDAEAAPDFAEEAPPTTPNYVARQLYLDPAPGGINAKLAWTYSGGKGTNIRIIDIEGAWRYTHEDLIQNQGGVIGGTPSTSLSWRNHGTAVIGEFGGDENAFGVTGIAPHSQTRSISIFGAGQSAAKAITDAANALSPGDIILIELHRPGPRHNYASRNDQLGYIAIEWWPADFAAIVYATQVRGVIVVEAAGNGAENLDDALYDTPKAGFPSSWTNPFDMSNPQSGAIVVGAGAPPPGTHGRDHGPDRSRLGFSNYGARVDAQGWGREVTTTGYGALQGGANEDLWYTDTFAGTSSASPIVVGAIACMQGALKAKSATLLTPATATNILRTTGSPQQDAPGRPATQRIGNRPNLDQAFTDLNIKPKVTDVKIKDVKDIQDFKVEEIKVRDVFKLKDTKEKEVKEYKEKDVKDFKDMREKPIERPVRPTAPSGAPAAEPSVEERVGSLERAVNDLLHFIGAEQRPDLQTTALSGEADLMALTEELAKQANDAKAAKDAKDVEKLQEN